MQSTGIAWEAWVDKKTQSGDELETTQFRLLDGVTNLKPFPLSRVDKKDGRYALYDDATLVIPLVDFDGMNHLKAKVWLDGVDTHVRVPLSCRETGAERWHIAFDTHCTLKVGLSCSRFRVTSEMLVKHKQGGWTLWCTSHE